MVFQAVQVLVALATHVAFVRLFFLHTHRAGVWCRCLGIDNRECSVSIVVQSLIVVAVLEDELEDDEWRFEHNFKLTDLWYFNPFWFL